MSWRQNTRMVRVLCTSQIRPVGRAGEARVEMGQGRTKGLYWMHYGRLVAEVPIFFLQEDDLPWEWT